MKACAKYITPIRLVVELVNPVGALMIGTGEYTTGYVHDSASSSDKGAGVVALALLDMRRRQLVDRLLMAGTNGKKFPAIRAHLQQRIAQTYQGIDVEFESFPANEVTDPAAYRVALSKLSAGDIVTIFTPDDTHAEIAEAAIKQGCHTLIAKPIVKTLAEHQRLESLAQEHDVLVAMEVHKRWDPIYRDARDRISGLGDFGYFTSYMSQPKTQLDTFRNWAGKSSDISYYLNAHHVDFHAWSLGDRAQPNSVFATCGSGMAKTKGINTEDTICLHVTWDNESGSVGTASYTASWIAPRSDVHSQQRFFYLGHHGEVMVDQAHRGYTLATDKHGFASANPLFMKYEPDSEGRFAGQDGYGYRSIEDFVLAANAIREGTARPSDFRGKLATLEDTRRVTAILEAGRRSLDESRIIKIRYEDDKVIGFE